MTQQQAAARGPPGFSSFEVPPPPRAAATFRDESANVLFEDGPGETVRRKLLHECDVHTLLRLPTGVFCAQGVKANVLFFDRKPASETPWTTLDHLQDFIKVYNTDNRHRREETEQFHRFITTN